MNKIRKGGKIRSGPGITSKASANGPVASKAIASARPSGETWRGEARDAIILSLSALKDASDATGLLAPLKATCALIIDGMETARSIEKNKEAWTELAENLDEQYRSIQIYIKQIDDKRSIDNGLRTILLAYVASVESILSRAETAKEYSQSGFMRRISRIRIDDEQIRELAASVDRAYKQFMEAMTVLLHQDMADMKRQLAELRFPTTESGMIDASDPFFTLVYGVDLPICQEGTRLSLLERIRDWAQDDSTSRQILWLNDMAGVGKTTIAATMAQEWKREHRLAGRFFFTPNSRAGSGISEFCLTIARDMFILMEPIRASLRSAILETPSSHFGFQEKLEKLVIQPLAEYDSNVFIVIDAVDNCDFEGRQKLLETLLAMLPKAPKVKVLLTSRPIPDIEKGLHAPTLVESCSMDLQQASKKDIRRYVEKELKDFSVDDREMVIARSDGLFIWASTACNFLKNSRRPKQVLKYIEMKTADNIDKLYFEVMKQASEDVEERSMLVNVLRIILSAFEPVSATTVQALLPQVDEVGTFIQDLGSVIRSLTPDQPIQIIHPTFREFLLDSNRSKEYHVDSASAHALMTRGCVEALHDSLSFDVFGLLRPGNPIPLNEDIQDLESKIAAKITPTLTYASKHWPYHATKAIGMEETPPVVRGFLCESLLNWIEFESWRGRIGQCIMSLSHLNTAVKASNKSHADLSAELGHVLGFVQQNQAIISRAALHAYCSALAFSSISGKIIDKYRGQFRDLIPMVRSRPIAPPDVMLLEGHRSIVHKMAFSPDVGRLASASFDGSLRLWDTSSGADITALVPTDGSRVSCITFSPDGQKLASGTEGGSLALWDARSGELLSLVLHTHDAEIFDVRFSGDGQRLLTASYDQIIRIWNVNLDTLEATEKDHSFGKYLQRVTFTPGEQGILSGRRQFLVHYDLETFTIIHSPIPPLAAPIMSIACSPIDAWFATGHHDGTVLTWDATSLTHKNILFMGNNYPVQGAGHTCFSASGTYLASKCYDVRLWHVTRDEFAEIRLTDAHRETKILAFSSDSRRLASMSEFDLRIWETSTGDLLQMMYNGRSLAVNAAVALSHDLNLVAMGNDRGTIQVCTPLTEGVNLEEPTSAIVALSFSPNGDFVATASHDASLKLWNTSTSELIWALESHHSYPLNSLVFSPDGLFVITVGYFDPMKIWNVRNGDEHILASSEVSQEAVKRIDFSDDGSLFALAFHSPILICIWNTRALVEQQDVLHELHGVPLPSNVMKFSSDNQLIALGLGSNIAVQHIINGTLLSTAAPNDAPIAQMAFSRMCDRLVTVTSYPYQIDLWSVTTELTHIAQIDFDNASPRAPLYIAPDSKYLVYGSLIWDITNPIPEPWTNRDLPRSLTGSTDLVQSLLSYGDGCIHFLSPPGRILLIPEHLGVIPSGDLLKPWRNWCAYGNTIALATRSGVPLIIDCSPMLRQMRPILADADDRSPLSSPGNATCRVIGEGT